MHTFSVSDRRRLTVLILGTLAAGVVNGLLGTGGGTILVPVFAYISPKLDTEDCLVTAMITILFLSVISFFTYGKPTEDDMGYLLKIGIPSAVGGLFGAFLGERMKPKALACLFSVLIIWSGIKMII